MNQNHALQHPSFHWTSFTETFLLFSGRPPDLHWKAKKLDRRFGTHRTDRQGYKKPEQIGGDYSAADQIGWEYGRMFEQIGYRFTAQTDYIGQDLEVEGSTMRKNAFYVPEVAQGSHKLNTLGLKNAFYIFLNLFRSQKSRNM